MAKAKQLPLPEAELPVVKPNQTEEAIVALAEVTKELIRIIQCFPNYNRLSPELKTRLVRAYTKATEAKTKVDIW